MVRPSRRHCPNGAPHRAKQRARHGHTMVETMVSVGVFAFVAGTTLALIHETSGVVASSFESGVARRHCSDVTDVLSAELSAANPATLVIDSTHSEGDQLQLQAPLGVAAGAVTWGAVSRADGTRAELAGGLSTILLVPVGQSSPLYRLVRRLTDAQGVAIGADEVLVEDVDGPDHKLGKGFTVTRSGDPPNPRGNLLTLQVRVCKSDGVRSRTIVIRLRNT